MGEHYHRVDVATEGGKCKVDTDADAFIEDNIMELIGTAELRPDVQSLIVYLASLLRSAAGH